LPHLHHPQHNETRVEIEVVGFKLKGAGSGEEVRKFSGFELVLILSF